MDENNNLEITTTVEPVGGISASQYLPIAGGVAVGILSGALLYRFVIGPAIRKYKEKKAADNAKPINEEPKEEEKKDEEKS